MANLWTSAIDLRWIDGRFFVLQIVIEDSVCLRYNPLAQKDDPSARRTLARELRRQRLDLSLGFGDGERVHLTAPG